MKSLLQSILTYFLGALGINVWTRKTTTGIDCWSCEQGNNVKGPNFGPEECQKYGKFIRCQKDQVSTKIKKKVPKFMLHIFPTSELVFIRRFIKLEIFFDEKIKISHDWS